MASAVQKIKLSPSRDIPFNKLVLSQSNVLLALTIDLQNILFTAFEQLLTARIEGAIASGTARITDRAAV